MYTLRTSEHYLSHTPLTYIPFSPANASHPHAPLTHTPLLPRNVGANICTHVCIYMFILHSEHAHTTLHHTHHTHTPHYTTHTTSHHTPHTHHTHTHTPHYTTHTTSHHTPHTHTKHTHHITPHTHTPHTHTHHTTPCTPHHTTHHTHTPNTHTTSHHTHTHHTHTPHTHTTSHHTHAHHNCPSHIEALCGSIFTNEGTFQEALSFLQVVFALMYQPVYDKSLCVQLSRSSTLWRSVLSSTRTHACTHAHTAFVGPPVAHSC